MKSTKDKKSYLTSDPEKWVELYGDYLYRFALGRLRDPENAQNVVQETFLAALTARKNFAGKSSERTWLISILKHKIIDLFRKNYREKPVTDLTQTEDEINSFFDVTGHPTKFPSDWKLDPSELLENKEFWGIFRDCMGKLPQNTRNVFQFKEIDKLDSKEICEMMKITPSNLWVMMYRARLQLRHCLEVNWFEKGQDTDL